MSLRREAEKGAKTAFVAAQMQNNDDVDGAKKLHKAVKDLASGLCKIKNDSGKHQFSKAEGSYPSGIKYVVLHSLNSGGASVKLSMSPKNTEITFDAKPHGNISGGTWKTATQEQALKSMSHWAGQVAPNLINDIGDTLDAFEVQQSVDNGDWDEAPTHN